MMRNYYALEQQFGNISVYSEYGRPILHVFPNKRDRDEFVSNYNATNSNPNHSAEETTSKVAYGAYSKIVDGVREWTSQVEVH